MRSIDADAIVYDEIEPGCYAAFKSDIDAQTTIDAIPLEWLEHQRTMCYPGSERELFLRRLISDWKREQNR